MSHVKQKRVTASRQEELINVIRGEDELGAVIRAHILIEAQLIRLLELLVPYKSHLRRIHLTYAERLELAQALGLKPQFGPPLKYLGTIRNDFAHWPNTHINKTYVDTFYSTLSKDDKAILRQCWKVTKQKTPTPPKGSFRQQQLRDQFDLMVITLHGILISAVNEIIDRIKKEQ